MASYQVKFWDVKKIGDTAKGRWRVRWAVAGREHCRSFAARPLADGFLTTLKTAAQNHQPFDETTGLPATPTGAAATQRTWYEHARGYAEMKWPDLAPKSRRSTAEALTTVTVALATRRRGGPDPKTLRRALFAWAFNPGTRKLTPPAGITAALEWIAAASQPVAALDDPERAAGRARCVRPHTGRQARRRDHPAAQTLRPVQRGRLRRREATAGGQPDRPHPVESPRGRRNRRPPRRRQPRPGPRPPCRGPRPGSAGASTWRRSSAACTTPRCARLRPSLSAKPTATCPAAAGGGSTWPPPSPAPGGPGPTTAPPARPAASSTAPTARCAPSPSRPPSSPCCAPTSRPTAPAPDGRLFRTARGRAIQDSAYSAVWQAAREAVLHPARARIPAGPARLRPAARRRVLVAELRGARHRGRPPRRAQRRRPAQGLRPLHRRPGRHRQQAHRRRPRR